MEVMAKKEHAGDIRRIFGQIFSRNSACFGATDFVIRLFATRVDDTGLSTYIYSCCRPASAASFKAVSLVGAPVHELSLLALKLHQWGVVLNLLSAAFEQKIMRRKGSCKKLVRKNPTFYPFPTTLNTCVFADYCP